MLYKLSRVYKEGDIELKLQIIGLIYPEKLLFDGNAYRIPRINVISQSILLINNVLFENKKGIKKIYLLYPLKCSAGQMSNFFIEDLEKILDIFNGNYSRFE